jgi:cysteine desulfurase
MHRTRGSIGRIDSREVEVKPIYLDYNATTPVATPVLEAMLPFLQHEYGNPSSAHALGWRAHEAVERARIQVAALIGSAPQEIVFTAGGTEASNLAIRGAALARPQRRHVLTSAFEHPATEETCKCLERDGFRVTRVPIAPDGRVRPEEVAKLLDDEIGVVTVMHANNELGTLQPVAEIARLARGKGALVHTDAAQSVGKIRVDVDALGVDLLTIAGHKLYAPKGVGALYVRRGTRLEPVLAGAGHERGLRPGTENVAGIVGLGKACELAERDMCAETMRLRGLRDELLARLRAAVPGVVLHGHPTDRLPNTLFLSFPGVPGGRLLESVPELCASTGSACHSGSDAPCASLLAIGVPPENAMGPVRLSLGRNTTVAEVEEAAALLAAAWRKFAPLGAKEEPVARALFHRDASTNQAP